MGYGFVLGGGGLGGGFLRGWGGEVAEGEVVEELKGEMWWKRAVR